MNLSLNLPPPHTSLASASLQSHGCCRRRHCCWSPPAPACCGSPGRGHACGAGTARCRIDRRLRSSTAQYPAGRRVLSLLGSRRTAQTMSPCVSGSGPGPAHTAGTCAPRRLCHGAVARANTHAGQRKLAQKDAGRGGDRRRSRKESRGRRVEREDRLIKRAGQTEQQRKGGQRMGIRLQGPSR